MRNSKEQDLLDLLTRHQVYLEGVKVKEQNIFSDTTRGIFFELRKLFSELDYENLGDLTKRDLNDLLKEIRSRLVVHFNTYDATLYEDLRDFMEVDFDLTKDILEDYSDDQLDEDRGSLFGALAVSGTKKGFDKLWATIESSPLPANGMLLGALLAAFSQGSITAIQNMVRQGYANNWTLNDALKAILGTKTANYRDGLVNKFGNQSNAIVHTLLQHISANVVAAVGSNFFERYLWASIIDNRTSNICRERNGHIYIFGKGPLPPAHMFCRSQIIILDDAHPDRVAPTFFAWLRTQPDAVQDDMMGEDVGVAIRSGKMTADNLPSFSSVKPLTFAQFKNKLKMILTASSVN